MPHGDFDDSGGIFDSVRDKIESLFETHETRMISRHNAVALDAPPKPSGASSSAGVKAPADAAAPTESETRSRASRGR